MAFLNNKKLEDFGPDCFTQKSKDLRKNSLTFLLNGDGEIMSA